MNSQRRPCSFLGPADHGEVVDNVVVTQPLRVVNDQVDLEVFVGGAGLVPEVVEAVEPEIFGEIILQ
jgi:hypothetical protein